MTQTEVLDMARGLALESTGGNDVEYGKARDLATHYLDLISVEASLREQLLSATEQLQKKDAKIAELQLSADGLERWILSRKDTSVFCHRPGDSVRFKDNLINKSLIVASDLRVDTVRIKRGVIEYDVVWWDSRGKNTVTVHQDEVIDDDVMKHPYEERS